MVVDKPNACMYQQKKGLLLVSMMYVPLGDINSSVVFLSFFSSMSFLGISNRFFYRFYLNSCKFCALNTSMLLHFSSFQVMQGWHAIRHYYHDFVHPLCRGSIWFEVFVVF